MEFKKYDKVYRLGHEDNQEIFGDPEREVCLQEKVDGANFRVYIKDGTLIFGAHNTQLTSDTGEDTNVQKNFTRAVNFVRETLRGKDLSAFNNLTLFMECMVKHTISYNWDITPAVLGFDVYNNEMGEYVHWKQAKELFELLGFTFVPILKECKVKDLTLPITDEMVPQSKYTLQKAEGIVFKTFNPRIYGKYVREEFKEKNKEVFGGGKKEANTDEEYFIALYCPNFRIEKQILKLMDEGIKLDRPMMKLLPNRVYEDIWEENWKEMIHLKQKTINFDSFRREVTKRCLIVLDTFIQNQLLNS
jgi:hypothetical protein